MRLIKENKIPKVSIILPVYNGEEYIAEAIDSIISQTFENWELIIVNDCSTDNSLKICEEYAASDDRIHVYSNEKNLKLPRSLNAGFKKATGTYYTWTSDDNMYRSDAIETMVRALEKEPALSMVYADFSIIDSDGNVIGKVEHPEPEYLLTGNIIGACFLYTAEIAKKVGGYDNNLFLAEDYDYWIHIYRQGKLRHIRKDLYLYRQHFGSLTETKRKYVNEQTYKTLEKNFLFMYEDAKKHHLVFQLFDHMIVRGGAHADDTRNMLIKVDRGYGVYLWRKEAKSKLKNTVFWKMFRKFLQKKQRK